MTFPLNSKKLSTKTEETTSYIHMASSRIKSSLMKRWSVNININISVVQQFTTIKTISILFRNCISLYLNAIAIFGWWIISSKRFVQKNSILPYNWKRSLFNRIILPYNSMHLQFKDCIQPTMDRVLFSYLSAIRIILIKDLDRAVR